MELGVEAARWMIGKALGPVSGGVLEAWAASTELGGNIEALRMELLYAEGMLNNARGHYSHVPRIKNPALSELLHKLRDLAYRADDALDEVDYFRIQDELEGTYNAAEEHEGGCLRNHALNARHAARAIAKMLGFSKCSACFVKASHDEPDEDTTSTKRVPPCGGHWPCIRIKASDNEEEEEDPRQGRVCWPYPCGSGTDQLVSNRCMGKITFAARSTIHTVGKHLPLPCRSSVSSAQNTTNSNARTTGCRFLCCARVNNKAPQIEHVVKTPKLEFDRVEMSQKIKDITEQLKPLCAKVSTILNLELLAANLNNTRQNMTASRPITTSESIEPEFYGRKGVTSKLIHDITKGEYCHVDLTILPVVGPGGIGKTTFTQHIYKKVHDQFEIKLWVCVSVNFNVSRLTQEIADKIEKEGKGSPESRIEEGLKSKKVSVNFNVSRPTQEIADKIEKEGKGSPESQIEKEGKGSPKSQIEKEEKGSPESRIEEGLKSKRFLLVLDDIWSCSNEDEWKRFLVPFRKEQTKGSVILVTTRFPAVAQLMVKTNDNWIDLKGIEEKEFEKLFIAYVFGNNEQLTEDQSKLLDIGHKIIKKLKGSPLAAKTVGRLLRNHLDLGHWTRVLESREWESQSGDHDIMPALKLSFDYLPFHLQQCFSYCSLFPDDYKFSEEEIIYFWIGLDLLHARGENKKIEDIGLSYLIELTNYGFFKKEKDDNGRTCYVIHDLMHELGMKVSSDECVSIYSSNVRSIQILPSIRHLSINIDDSSVSDRKTFDTCKEDFSVLRERLRIENLHSLMIFGKHQGSFAKTLHGLFSKAKALRAILISGDFYSMEDLLHNFSELIHLRYLRVHSNEFYEDRNKIVALESTLFDSKPMLYRGNKLIASNSISIFYHMRVLDLYGCHDRMNLPRNMTNLLKLRHFVIQDDSMHSGISEVGKMKSLQELKRFEVGKKSEGFELSQIGDLLELCGSLRIDNLENVDGREGADKAKLIHKRNLIQLILNWSASRSNKDHVYEEQVLEGLKPHSNLKKLSIRRHGGGTCPSWLGVNLSVQNLESLCLDGVDWEIFPPIGGELQQINRGAEQKLSNSPNQLLKHLKRIELANLKRLERWVIDSRSGQLLSRLEALEITCCPELVEVVFSDCNSTQQDLKTLAPNVRRLEIRECPKLLSLPPVPWNCSPNIILISEVGLGFKALRYLNARLSITGKGSQGSASFWTSLNFDNLSKAKELWMHSCPPVPLDGLEKMSALKRLEVSNCNDAFGPVEEHAGYRFEVESMGISRVGATSGKELTQILSCMPKLSALTIEKCEKIIGLGVVEEQQEEAMASSSRRSREKEEDIGEAEEGLLLLPRQLHELSISSCPELRLRPLHNSVLHRENENENENRGGLQTLCSLRSLRIWDCPKLLSCYSSSSSISPFPSSLQSLELSHMETLPPLSNLASLSTLEIFKCGGDVRGVGLGHLLAHGSLQELSVRETTNLFDPDELSSILSSSRSTLLSSLTTGVLAVPICRFLSSSLTNLVIYDNKEMERFTEEQDEALQLLTSLQHLRFSECEKLQSLPAGLHRLTSLKTLEIRACPSIHLRLLPKDALPNSLQNLTISFNSAIRSLPKDVFPDSLQELHIKYCPSIRSLPKGGLPTSLKLLKVSGGCEGLKGQRRNLIGTIPIVELD